ncbi:MAG: alkaline phosphatase family protein [Planctomycetes bacterium]|nr:alkaline phosphatase family protein [Planctomycetota bacterium]
MATGKTADRHGILHFIEPDPANGGMRVSMATSRKTKALWNILTQAGLRTNVLSWYASHPAEPINGCVISNLMQEGMPQSAEKAWPLMKGAVHPASAAEQVAQMRLHPGELQPQELLGLLPHLETMSAGDPRIALVAKLLANCVSVHNLATAMLAGGSEHGFAQAADWDCSMLFYDAIDVFGHHFMQYHAPRMNHVSDQDFTFYRDVMNGVYEFLDAMLGVILQIVGDGTTVILLSDHGFHSDHLRPAVPPAVDDEHAAMDATWHRPLGVLAMKGPGIRQGETIYGANLLDIAPTVLTLLGQPIGADMNGRVLVEALDTQLAPSEIERVFSWDDLEGEAGLHPADLRIDPFAAHQAMKQLADLGYVNAPSADQASQLATLERETSFNLGVVYMTTRRAAEALLEKRKSGQHLHDFLTEPPMGPDQWEREEGRAA